MKNDAERQHAYQKRQKQAGLVRLHCWATPATRQALREIAERHARTVGEVLELGMLLARQHLKVIPKSAPAQRRAVLIARSTAEPASSLLSAPTLLSDIDTSAAPTEPAHIPPSSPKQPDDSDVRIRAAH